MKYNLKAPIVMGQTKPDTTTFEYELTMFADRSLCVVVRSMALGEGYFEPYATLAVNLANYGKNPGEHELFIHHNVVNSACFDSFYEEFCDKEFGKRPVAYGYVESVHVKLNKEWCDKVDAAQK